MPTRREALALLGASTVGVVLDEPRGADATSLANNAGDPTRVIPEGEKSADARLGPAKTLDDHFPFQVPPTREAWLERRKQLREQVLVASGVWPMPERGPIPATVHGAIEREGYTVSKVSFPSLPGHYVSGNLYRPTKPGKAPGVLFAHGHWAGGRFHDDGEKAAAASVKSGGEPDIDRGRFFVQALPATLARLGFVVFAYDMIGYADSTAITHREGFKDAAAELRLISFFGLQTWNSIRALDFLCSLPEVDPKRLGMTGASGGGTQTFILGAIDDRLTTVFPAVMVSTGMQGGCICENASHLRVNTGNVELAALFAPRPHAMSAANDWTKALMQDGYPELQKLYDLYDAKDKVQARAWLEYGHQYNVHARQMMYGWFLKHLMNEDADVKEFEFKPIPPKELSVYDEAHPRPKDELAAGPLREQIGKASDEQLAKLSPEERRKTLLTALRVMCHTQMPKEIAVRSGPLASKLDGILMHRAIFGRKNEKDAVPTAGLIAPKFTGEKLALWLHPKGKASLHAEGVIVPEVKSLMAAGYAVVAPDVWGIGELACPPLPVDKPQYKHVYAGYTFGYNRAALANRVHDALTLVAFGTTFLKVKRVDLIGWGELGPVAVMASALAGESVTKTVADLNRFRFDAIKDIADPMMLPGAVKYGGLPAFLTLGGSTLAHNAKGCGATASKLVTLHDEALEPAKIVEWLCG